MLIWLALVRAITVARGGTLQIVCCRGKSAFGWRFDDMAVRFAHVDPFSPSIIHTHTPEFHSCQILMPSIRNTRNISVMVSYKTGGTRDRILVLGTKTSCLLLRTALGTETSIIRRLPNTKFDEIPDITTVVFI